MQTALIGQALPTHTFHSCPKGPKLGNNERGKCQNASKATRCFSLAQHTLSALHRCFHHFVRLSSLWVAHANISSFHLFAISTFFPNNLRFSSVAPSLVNLAELLVYRLLIAPSRLGHSVDFPSSSFRLPPSAFCLRHDPAKAAEDTLTKTDAAEDWFPFSERARNTTTTDHRTRTSFDARD